MLARRDRKPSSSRNLAQLLATTADAGYAIDPGGRIVAWNRAAESLLGHPASEAVGRACCDLLLGHDGNGNRVCCRGCHVMARVKMREPVHNFDMGTRTKVGSPIWVNVSTLAVLGDEAGATTVHLLRDVTATREVLALSRERPSVSPPPAPTAAESNGNGTLTRRELELLGIIATGLNTKDAAEKLHVSPATVRNHVQNILNKLGAHSRLEAVAYATRRRLI
jgi:PAS domain S-box-containing protein